jgi:hypothetical protein
MGLFHGEESVKILIRIEKDFPGPFVINFVRAFRKLIPFQAMQKTMAHPDLDGPLFSLIERFTNFA